MYPKKHAVARTHVLTRMHALARTHTYLRMHTHIGAQAHTYTYARMYVHTHTIISPIFKNKTKRIGYTSDKSLLTTDKSINDIAPECEHVSIKNGLKIR